MSLQHLIRTGEPATPSSARWIGIQIGDFFPAVWRDGDVYRPGVVDSLGPVMFACTATSIATAAFFARQALGEAA